VILAGAVVMSGCVPGRPNPSAPATPSPSAAIAPAGWTEVGLDGSDVRIALPDGWLVLDEADLADAGQRAQLETTFAGAEELFDRLDAQGSRAPLVLLGVDQRELGAGRFPPVVTVVAVEPPLPALLLGVGADFAADAFGSTFELETDVTQGDIETPIGRGIRLQFSHRLVGPEGGPGFALEHDGSIVTTGDATFLVSRNVDPDTAPADTPTLEDVLATLRVEP
jgi:hypothetical protein